MTCTRGINLTDNFRNMWKTACTVYNCQKFRTVFPHAVTVGVFAWTGTAGSGKAALRAATSAV
jgi:sorbitol-specific phosphotransferase system component IIC